MTADDVLAIFRRVRETEDIAATDDFFDLGGDSLLATRVLSAVARVGGAELSMEDFLLAPTPELLAARIGTGAGVVVP
ncbi:MAG: acyl carrier protein [Catenulispora sp.]|nr:acyl carrier protein [Catenulispora sp.]